MKSSRISIVLAATALVVALFAATPISQAAGKLVLGRNSVGTPQLKKNAVTGPKVKNGSLTAADFKSGQLPAGPQGPQGPKGETGARGPAGPSDAFIANDYGPFTISPTGTTVQQVTLPAGQYVLTGRVDLVSGPQQIIRCGFAPSGTNADVGTTIGGGYETAAVVTDIESLASPATVTLRCRGNQSAQGWLAVITAIKVGSLTVQ